MIATLYVLAAAVAAFYILYANLLTNARGSWCRHLRKMGRLLVFAGCLMGIAAVLQDGWKPRVYEVVLMSGLAIVAYLQARSDIKQVHYRRAMGIVEERRT